MIQFPSAASLLLGVVHGDNHIGTATGFVVTCENRPYLVTNRHVVTGRHQETGALLDSEQATPQFLDIVHNSDQGLGTWVARRERLYDYEIEPLWLEHPTLGPSVDVIALPLTETSGITLYSYDPWLNSPDVRIEVTTELSIVGFPYGRAGGGQLAIWTRGTIASEPDVDIDDLPRLFVDSRTRAGQSGSPAIVYKSAGGVDMTDGSMAFFDGPVRVLVGVYSGRLNSESDLGYVWRLSALQEILLGGKRGSDPHCPS